MISRLRVGLVGVALLVLSACSGGGSSATPTAAAPTTAAPTAAAASPAASAAAPAQPNGGQSAGSQPAGSRPASSQPADVGNGCVPNSAKRPAGAVTGRTADLDLDGDPDTLWLATVNNARVVGVTTASGATFSTTYASAAPGAPSAIGQKMAPAGPAIVLLDTGRAVLLFDVVDCSLVPSANAQGAQYTFDLGFTGYGTGVECVRSGAGYTLAGLLAAPESSGGGNKVTRTTVTLSAFGKQARNGTTTVLARHAAPGSAIVQRAHTVTCGTAAQVTQPNGG